MKAKVPVEELRQVRLLQFETATYCNASCRMCPHEGMGRRGNMTIPEIVDLTYHLAHRTVECCPFGMQEPLVTPKLLECALSNLKVYNPQIKTTVYTNMGLYPQKYLENIVKWGTLDNLIISFYGPTQKLYNEIQKGLDYKQTKRNIKRFLRMRNRKGWYAPRVTLDFLVTEDTYPYVKQVQREWEGIVDVVGFTHEDAWCGLNKYYNREFQERIFGAYPPRTPCQRLWTQQQIHYNGNVVACCLDYNDELVIGNIYEDGYNVWWSSEKLTELRKLHTFREWDKIPLCRDCVSPYYNNSKEWIEFWLKKWKQKPVLYAPT